MKKMALFVIFIFASITYAGANEIIQPGNVQAEKNEDGKKESANNPVKSDGGPRKSIWQYLLGNKVISPKDNVAKADVLGGRDDDAGPASQNPPVEEDKSGLSAKEEKPGQSNQIESGETSKNNDEGRVKVHSYLVESRDTLRKIGKKVSVYWETLAKRNKIKSPYQIREGQRLIYNEEDVLSQKKVAPKKQEQISELGPKSSMIETGKEGPGDEDWKKQALIPRKENPEQYSKEMEAPKQAGGKKEGNMNPGKKAVFKRKKSAAPKEPVLSQKKEGLKKKSQGKIASQSFRVRDVFRDLLCNQGRFQKLLSQFGLNDVEGDELRKRIIDRDFRWGLARKGDRFDLELGNKAALENPEVVWKNQEIDLAAADVYRVSSGKEIWIFLKDGKIYLHKKRNPESGPISEIPVFRERTVERMISKLKNRPLTSNPPCADAREESLDSRIVNPQSLPVDDSSKDFEREKRNPANSSAPSSKLQVRTCGVAVSPGNMTDKALKMDLIYDPDEPPLAINAVEEDVSDDFLDDKYHVVEPKPLDGSAINSSRKKNPQSFRPQAWTGGVAVSPGKGSY